MSNDKRNENLKQQQLDLFKSDDKNKKLTTNQALPVSVDDFSLKAGVRGPTLMEDFHFREKMTHFDHERIPERVVHARGFAAHGMFELYDSMEEYTTAKFLTEVGKKTPVFVRFSTVVGSKGSGELARDVRGFATKFYTEEGNYDLVGNNIPVFFIQDAIKFPDVIHAAKPEPQNEIPQAATAHDTFWDFVVSNQETANMVMWIMSDRAIPRSFRMMEGFGVNTFRFVNKEGVPTFVKFHWKPKLGVHSVVWDEAQKINGKNPDFHRQDLYENIEHGNYPEYELGVQLLPAEDEFKFDFDILDATKLWPEEDVPVRIIGKMMLNQNVDNVFAETEQVAFHPGNVVPGIDFTNDPLLQGRLFSYTDTQLIRLGGPNFHELPINRPICPFHNNQRDGYGRQTINIGQVAYHQNSLWDNTPAPVPKEDGGYAHYEEKVEGRTVQARSKSFLDFFSQATMFWNSMSDPEKRHIINAFSFELGMVNSQSIKEKAVQMFANVSLVLAEAIARNIGVEAPISGGSNVTKASPALSQANTVSSPETKTVAVLITDGFDDERTINLLNALRDVKAEPSLVGERLGIIRGRNGTELNVGKTLQTGPSVLFDSVYLVGGDRMNKGFSEAILDYINEAYKHYKPIGSLSENAYWLQYLNIEQAPGVIVERNSNEMAIREFIEALGSHRFLERQIVRSES